MAVGRLGNLKNAAQEIGVSQPAATKIIQDLEVDFGVELINRTNRGTVPTIFGDTLIRHSKLVFAQLSHAVQEMEDLRDGKSGRVVIGTLLAASTELLPTAISLLLVERPNVSIKIIEGTNDVLIPALLSGDIDLVVGRLPSRRQHGEIIQEKLLDDKIVAFVSAQHPLAGAKRVGFDDLREFGWILPPAETSLRRQIDRFFLKQDQYTPPIVVESVSYLANRALLKTQNLIGLAPSQVMQYDFARGDLIPLQWDVPLGVGAIGVSRRAGVLSPPAQACSQALQRVAADLTHF